MNQRNQSNQFRGNPCVADTSVVRCDVIAKTFRARRLQSSSRHEV